MRFALSLLLLLLWQMLVPQVAVADWLYSSCIMGYQLGGDILNVQPYTVSPINATCHTSCTSTCQQFSTKISGYEMNADVLLACQSACQGGQSFTSSYKTFADPTNPTTTLVPAAPLTVASPCGSGSLMQEASIV